MNHIFQIEYVEVAEKQIAHQQFRHKVEKYVVASVFFERLELQHCKWQVIPLQLKDLPYQYHNYIGESQDTKSAKVATICEIVYTVLSIPTESILKAPETVNELLIAVVSILLGNQRPIGGQNGQIIELSSVVFCNRQCDLFL